MFYSRSRTMMPMYDIWFLFSFFILPLIMLHKGGSIYIICSLALLLVIQVDY